MALFGFASTAIAQAPQKPAGGEPTFEIRRFVFEGATLVPSAELEEATRQYTGPGRNFGDVQRTLETIERHYARAGWSAVQVLLPEQELERGEVRFRIIEAHVGRVVVEGNKFFDEANIRASLPSLQPGRAPNIHGVARDLRIANESPSKQATVLLRSGQEAATVDAVVRVVDENPQRASITVDNTGYEQSGKIRMGLGYQNSNLFNLDHVLTLQYVGSLAGDDPKDFQPYPGRHVLVVGAGYHVPLYASGNSLDFSAGHSSVSSGTVQNLFSVTGAGDIAGARFTQNLDKTGDYEHRVLYSLDYRAYDNSGVRLVGTATQLVPDVTVHPLTVLYSGLLRRQQSESTFSAGFSQNLPGGNDGGSATFCASRSSTAGGQTECARASYLIWRWAFNHNQALAADWQWRVGMNGQLTRDLLVSGEQFGVGGMDSVRGFLEREIINDYGYRGTFELYTPDYGGKTGMIGARLRALAFVDWGAVKRNNPSPGEQAAEHISSYGLGLRFSRGNNLSFRADYGFVLEPGGSQHRGDARLHGSISYIF